MTVWEIMGRIAHAKDRATMAQKKMGELWQWVCGREDLREALEINAQAGELEMCNAAIEKLQIALHDLQLVRDELTRADR